MNSVAHQTIITHGAKSQESSLTGIKGPCAGREFVLIGRQAVLGRGEQCDILLRDLNVSRKHAILWVENSSYHIRDNRSKNGTYVNGNKIEKKVLKDGDSISIGESILIFRVGPSSTNKSRLTKTAGISRKTNDFHMAVRSNRSLFGSLFKNLNFSAPAKRAGVRVHSKSFLSQPKFWFYAGLTLLIVFLALPLIGPQEKKKKAAKFPPEKKAPAVRVISKPRPAAPSAITEPSASKRASKVLPADLSLARQKYSQASQALQSGNFRSAIDLLEETLALNPNHPIAKEKLAEANQALSTMIEELYTSGLRDFANLYYDRALNQWEKVAALSQDFDPNYHRKAQNKIEEARNQLEKTR